MAISQSNVLKNMIDKKGFHLCIVFFGRDERKALFIVKYDERRFPDDIDLFYDDEGNQYEIGNIQLS